MSNRILLFSISLFFPLIVFASKAHEHGKAKLFIAAENNQVLIELESPADNLLGFEHAPKTAKQRALLKQVLKKLTNYSSVVGFDWVGCEQVSVEVKPPFPHAENHHHKHQPLHGHKSHDTDTEHSDFHVTYMLACSRVSLPATVEVTTFKSFHGFDEINVNWVISERQGSKRATTSKTVLKFK